MGFRVQGVFSFSNTTWELDSFLVRWRLYRNLTYDLSATVSSQLGYLLFLRSRFLMWKYRVIEVLKARFRRYHLALATRM